MNRRIFILGFVCVLIPPMVHGGPDSVLEPLRIGSGHAPDIAVDVENEVIHLLYLDGSGVYYRSGSIRGVFGPPEKIIEKEGTRYWYPRIVLDKNGIPHVVFCDLTPDTFNAKEAYYSNRVGGAWKKPLTVFSVDQQDDKWVNFPHLVIDDDADTVYLACKNKKPPIFGEVARLEKASTDPKVAVKREVEIGGISMLMLDGELQIFGGEKGMWHLFEFNKQTMEPTGKILDMAAGLRTEQIRAYHDATGEVHFVGATWDDDNDKRGFYNTLSRVNAGEKMIRYMTTNGHHCGNGRVVRDAVNAERIYNFHFSGATGGKHGVYYSHDCEYSNQVHFVRIQNGDVVEEHQRITDRHDGHGSSYRLQVAAGPHPRGGVFVVFPECGGGKQILNITLVGECADDNPLGGGMAANHPKAADNDHPFLRE